MRSMCRSSSCWRRAPSACVTRRASSATPSRWRRHERQAEVFARVRRLAAAQAAEFPALPDIVEAAYRVLVAGFIAGEERFFAETEPIPS